VGGGGGTGTQEQLQGMAPPPSPPSCRGVAHREGTAPRGRRRRQDGVTEGRARRRQRWRNEVAGAQGAWTAVFGDPRYFKDVGPPEEEKTDGVCGSVMRSRRLVQVKKSYFIPRVQCFAIMYMDAFCIENAPILISIDFAQLQLD
jgi:hypothetical protein